MVGDLTYDVHLLERGRVPGVGRRHQLRVTTAMTNAMLDRHPDVVVLPAHDPGAAARLVAAGGDSPGQQESRLASRNDLREMPNSYYGLLGPEVVPTGLHIVPAAHCSATTITRSTIGSFSSAYRSPSAAAPARVRLIAE
jgi:hypothetical protein